MLIYFGLNLDDNLRVYVFSVSLLRAFGDHLFHELSV